MKKCLVQFKLFFCSCSVTYPSGRSAWCLDRGGGCALGILSILFSPKTQIKVKVPFVGARTSKCAFTVASLVQKSPVWDKTRS